jgi:hypothetical protein
MSRFLRTLGLSSEISALVIKKWNKQIPFTASSMKLIVSSLKKGEDSNYYFKYGNQLYQIGKHDHFVPVHQWIKVKMTHFY